MDRKYGRIFTADDVKAIAFKTAEEIGLDPSKIEQLETQIANVIDIHDGVFPKDEPLFILRGTDPASPDTIYEYQAHAARNGSNQNHIEFAGKTGEEIELWQQENAERVKVADS